MSRPEPARRSDLTGWSGFDPLSTRPDAGCRSIEVRGRVGAVEVSENERAEADGLRNRHRLHAVLNCAEAGPRLVRVQNPFKPPVANTRSLSEYS